MVTYAAYGTYLVAAAVLATSDSIVAPTIAAIGTVMVALSLCITAYATLRNGKLVRSVDTHVKEVHFDVKDVQNQVTTMNSLSQANLADNAEKRRAEKIPEAERTADEQIHVDSPMATGMTEVPGVPKTT